MKQEEFNLLVRAIVFASSTDSCMNSDATDGVVDALGVFISENPEFIDGLEFESLYIYGTDSELQEDPEINAELLSMFKGKLENRGY